MPVINLRAHNFYVGAPAAKPALRGVTDSTEDTVAKVMPRLVTEKGGAAHLGLELATFRSWVTSGRLPSPLPDCGKFDVKALDAAIDRISGLGNPANALDSWRALKGGRSDAR